MDIMNNIGNFKFFFICSGNNIFAYLSRNYRQINCKAIDNIRARYDYIMKSEM